MSRKKNQFKHLRLNGLEMAPSQVWGGVRLVPLLRHNSRGDLRLSRRTYDDNRTVVNLDKKTVYCSYVPHALVTSWTNDGTPIAAVGCQIQAPNKNKFKAEPVSELILERMVRREKSKQLRFLPMHLAMEGFLALHFGGPDIAWQEYSADTSAYGLGCRIELAYSGNMIGGLADALRVFEIHEQQVGVLIFVADALASAFVVSHPDDYRALHPSLIEDFYGELIYEYGYLYPKSNSLETYIDEKQVSSLNDLRKALTQMRSDFAQFQNLMAAGLFERQVLSQDIYKMGPFQLQRFLPEIQLRDENHIGEAIIREDGTLEYLKTYRLSEEQCRRGHLLTQLAAHDWNISATAKTLQYTYKEFILRLESVGFGDLLKPHILKAAQRRKRKA